MKISVRKGAAFIVFLVFTCFTAANSQEFNKACSKDSLLQAIIKDMPKDKQNEFVKYYNSGNDKDKEFLLFMGSMPRSSKKAMISNIDTNYEKISYLKQQYSKLVPLDYIVSIEFEPANNVFSIEESITLKIDSKDTSMQQWQLSYTSDTLQKMLRIIGWNTGTVMQVKKMLTDAHCISIENGKETTIGFSRSGMGIYSYLISDEKLNTDAGQYSNECNYILYKNNVLLEYEGGAIGPQCFPD